MCKSAIVSSICPPLMPNPAFRILAGHYPTSFSYPHHAQKKHSNIPLIQTRNKISLRSLRQKANNPKPTRLLVVSRSTVRPNRIFQDLLSSACSLQFGGVCKASDNGHLCEGGAGGGGGECAGGGGEGAAEEEGRHFDCLWGGFGECWFHEWVGSLKGGV